MCKELEREQERGKLAAKQLALHLMAMGGAIRADVRIGGEEGRQYIVSICELPIVVPPGTPRDWATQRYGTEGVAWEYAPTEADQADLEARAKAFKDCLVRAASEHELVLQNIPAEVLGDALLLMDNWEPK